MSEFKDNGSRITPWFDPAKPPDTAAHDAGNGVWFMWVKDKLMLWHWCDRSIIIARDKDRVPDWYMPQWVLVGTEAHERSGKNFAPTLHPSVHWPYCCSKHGYLDQGKWRDI